MTKLLPFGCVHSSTVIKHKGQVYVTYFAGPREGHPNTQIWLNNVTEGWLIQITNLDEPHWNPVLFEWEDGLYLTYKVGPHPWKWETCGVLLSSYTSNRPMEPLFEHIIDGGPVKNKPIIMSNGQLIAGHSVESVSYPHAGWKCYASLLEPADHQKAKGYHLDARETWTNVPIDSSAIPGRGVIQPTLWESTSGHIHMFMRSAMGHICRADSEDYGRTWCPAYPVKDLLNNNSGIDVVKVPMSVSDHLMNPVRFEPLYLVSNPIKGEGMSARTRTPLTIMRSSDNGITWDKWVRPKTGRYDSQTHHVLEYGEGEFSYPAIIYDPDTQHLLVSYTYNKHSIKLVSIPLGD